MNGEDSVVVCHGESEILIHLDALASHLAHGDCVGNCEENSRYSNVTQTSLNGQLSINVSPNPSQVLANIQINGTYKENQNLIVSLYDYTGHSLKEIYNGNAANNSQLLDIEINKHNLNPGIYFVKALYGSEYNIQKLIIPN